MADQSEIAELQRQLQEVRRAKEEAEQRAEKAEQRAEEERRAKEEERRAKEEERRAKEEERRAKEEERRAKEEAERRAEKAEKAEQHATLAEYLDGCHSLLFSKFTIRTYPERTPGNSITNSCNKWCPTDLQPWEDFIPQQRHIFAILNKTFPMDSRLFPSCSFSKTLGQLVSSTPIVNECSLRTFLFNVVETPVKEIINQLKKFEDVREAFAIKDGIVFENQAGALKDADEALQKKNPTTPPNERQQPNHLQPDQICITRPASGSLSNTIVYISEYKSPCKLTIQHLRAGLRPMDIHRDVVNRKTIPTSQNKKAHFQYQADRLTASAITQTYHYMIECGLEYSTLTIGQAIVFLKIDWKEPGTLLYHLTEPNPEVSAHPNNSEICTAVGQYLAFTLMALGSPGERRVHDQQERHKAKSNLKPWAEDFEATVKSLSKVALSDYSPDFQPTTYKAVERSPYLLRSNNNRQKAPDTPTPVGRTEQYCTQKCLLGLVQGGFLDPKCPNIALHCKNGLTKARHPVSHKEWLKLLWEQLTQSWGDGITKLDQGGACGVLFRITLLVYGYTFVAKGTVRALINDLKHEAAVYNRLKPIQGHHVPVFLGAIDLRETDFIYYYDFKVYIVYMMLLSWGGDRIENALTTNEMGKDLKSMAIMSLRAIHDHGVIHEDVRSPNLLFNQEVKKVVVIDFERSSLLEPPRRALTQLTPNKRKRGQEEKERKKADMLSYGTRQERKRFYVDINEAEFLFLAE
ncbi:hypothetical protein F4774DRAFT_422364 [Daldinia eschscholtzii]|nr:hypothetical protein F4774DRAFT_422364 [Daldinia eschscholtzii]